MGKTPKFDALADGDKAFVVEYFRCNYNAAAAFSALGLDAEHKLAHSKYGAAHRLRNRADISGAIEEMLAENTLSSLELLQRHSEIASADIADLVDDKGCFDFKEARRRGKTRLIKAITTRKWWDKNEMAEVTETRVELHNAQQAQLALMKHRGLFVEAIKTKDLPTDPDELAALLAKQIERTTGQKVTSAGKPKDGN